RARTGRFVPSAPAACRPTWSSDRPASSDRGDGRGLAASWCHPIFRGDELGLLRPGTVELPPQPLAVERDRWPILECADEIDPRPVQHTDCLAVILDVGCRRLH